jgi:hypothetical protein
MAKTGQQKITVQMKNKQKGAKGRLPFFIGQRGTGCQKN